MDEEYKNQVALLLEVLPYTSEKAEFALKGGTALNLFFLDMPRLSVDIDLCYLPLQDRKSTFTAIHRSLKDIKTSLEKNLKCKVFSSNPLNGEKETKLFVEKEGVQIKIEPNYTLRGSLFSPTVKTISKSVAETFKVAIECTCLTEADLLGGKICAALDRQHPRDLFDIKLFLDRGAWDRKVTDAFIAYLISHNRPIHELLNPNLLPIRKSFAEEFEGMSFLKISVDELENARVALVEELKKRLNENDKKFLVSVAKGEPIWNLVFDSKIQEWPSIKWKLLNISKMDVSKRERQVKELKDFFGF